MPVYYALCALIGCLLGSVNGGFLCARYNHKDIFTLGNKSAGASNTALTLGLRWGIIAGVIDMAKTAVAWLLGLFIFPDLAYASLIAAAFTMIGHCFSVFMKFRGGRGFACSAILFLLCDWKWAVCTLAVFIVLALICQNLYQGCIVTYASFIVCSALSGNTVQLIVSAVLCGVFIFITRRNFINIFIAGKTEAKISELKKHTN